MDSVYPAGPEIQKQSHKLNATGLHPQYLTNIQGVIIKFALFELAFFFKYFAQVRVNCGVSKPS